METSRYDEPTGPSDDPQVDALNQAYAKLSAAELSDADREALNDPELKAARSKEAYGLKAKTADGKSIYGGNAWASRRGMEVVGDRKSAVGDTVKR